MTMGRNKNITFEKAQEFIERSQQIREEINQLNAEICELMDWDYTPPRGFSNPLAKSGEEGRPKGSKKKKGEMISDQTIDKFQDAVVPTR
jgi:hypothetical protein